MPRKVTVNLIAQYAGVSRGTVDRVLNQRPHVRPDIYDRVVKAMRELDYIPPTEKQAIALGLTLPAREFCKLGILLPNERGYFRTEVLRGITDAQVYLKAYSAEVIVQECETDLPDEIIERMENLLAEGAAGIALRAKDHISIAQKINALHEQRIPVITYNSDIASSKRLCFIGQDLVQGGRVAGELMSKFLQPDDPLLIAVGNPEFDAHRLRLQGFCERLHEKGYPGDRLKIIETYNDYTLTYQKVLEALESDPSLRCIYMANRSVTGCAEAIRQAGRQGQIHVISHDLTESSRRLLQTGEISFTIAQNLYQQGYRALTTLYEYIQQHTIPHPENDLAAIDIVCSENLTGRT